MSTVDFVWTPVDIVRVWLFPGARDSGELCGVIAQHWTCVSVYKPWRPKRTPPAGSLLACAY